MILLINKMINKKLEVNMSENKSTTTIAKKEEVKNTLIAEKKEEVKAKEAVEAQPKSLNMAYLYNELQAVKQVIQEHSQQIAELQEALVRKRKAVPNGKVQIRDKQTNKVYPSKNATYQTLLKAGELKDLVNKGIFGDNPAKNTFGWYALVRELPDRFEEVKSEQTEPQV